MFQKFHKWDRKGLEISKKVRISLKMIRAAKLVTNCKLHLISSLDHRVVRDFLAKKSKFLPKIHNTLKSHYSL